MPVFVYRAVTDKGKIVRNKVDEISRRALINKLRRNNLTPINIVQVRSKIVVNNPIRFLYPFSVNLKPHNGSFK